MDSHTSVARAFCLGPLTSLSFQWLEAFDSQVLVITQLAQGTFEGSTERLQFIPSVQHILMHPESRPANHPFVLCSLLLLGVMMVAMVLAGGRRPSRCGGGGGSSVGRRVHRDCVGCSISGCVCSSRICCGARTCFRCRCSCSCRGGNYCFLASGSSCGTTGLFYNHTVPKATRRCERC